MPPQNHLQMIQFVNCATFFTVKNDVEFNWMTRQIYLTKYSANLYASTCDLCGRETYPFDAVQGKGGLDEIPTETTLINIL